MLRPALALLVRALCPVLVLGLALGAAGAGPTEAEGGTRPYGIDLRFSLSPTTNITGGTGAETVQLGDLTFRPDAASRAEPGVALDLGLTAWALVDRDGPRRSVLAAHVERRFHFTRLRADTLDYGLRLTTEDRSPQGRLSFGPHLEITEEAGEIARRRIGFALGAERALTPRLRLSGTVDLIRQSYPDAPHRDGARISLRPRLDYALTRSTRLSLELPLLRETAEAAHLAHRDWEIGLGLRHQRPSGLGIGLRLGLGGAAYDGDYPGFGTAREDRSASLSLTLRPSSLVWRGLSPEITLTRRVQDSTIPLHDSAATEVGLVFTRRF